MISLAVSLFVWQAPQALIKNLRFKLLILIIVIARSANRLICFYMHVGFLSWRSIIFSLIHFDHIGQSITFRMAYRLRNIIIDSISVSTRLFTIPMSIDIQLYISRIRDQLYLIIWPHHRSLSLVVIADSGCTPRSSPILHKHTSTAILHALATIILKANEYLSL